MRLKMPRLAPSLVPWLLPSIDSLFGVLKNGSAAALSGGVPGLDADWATPCESRRRRREREAYCSPWPSWETRPPSSGGPPANRPPYRVGRGLLGDVPGHRPAHDLAGEGACRGREIGPSFSCGHACDAARPKPVAPARGESALCQVQPGASRLGLLLDAAFSGRAPSGKPGLPHDAGHAILARGDAAFCSSRLMRRWPQRPLCRSKASTTNPSSASRPIWTLDFFRPRCS